jgi:hypothetical protein
MNKKLITTISILLIAFTLLSTVSTYAVGKRIIAENKYIWIYVNGERKIIPENSGYPCFGQGLDNKNVLYVPLEVICNILNWEVSNVKNYENPLVPKEYIFYVTVSNGKSSFDVVVGSNKFDTKTMAGNAFILKGTEYSRKPVVMVPLGVAKDYFGLDLEVKRPVGRGVYDYCSLAINFSSENLKDEDMDGFIDVPSGSGSEDEKVEIPDWEVLDGYFFVSSLNDYYHIYTCDFIGKDYAQLSEYECYFWGYEKCPDCLVEDSQQQ